MEQVFQKRPPCSSSKHWAMRITGVKRMRVSLLVAFVASLLMLPVAQVAYGEALTVQTGEDYYSVGSVVPVKGTAAADAAVDIIIRVNSIQIFEDEVKANSTGGYELNYTLPSNATLGIYTINVISGTSFSEASFTVTTSSIGEIARQLIESAKGSQALAGGTLRDIIALGYNVSPTVNSEMTQGQDAITEANSLSAKGIYAESAEAAQGAMNHFRNALVLALGETEGYEYTPSQRETLTYRLEMLVDKLSQASALVSNLSQDDLNLPTLTSLLESAESSLTLASSKIGEGSYDEAAQALAASQKDIQDAMQIIKSNLNQYRRGLVTQFAGRLRERINSSRTDLDQLSNQIQVSYMYTATQRLGEANGLNTRAENRLQEGLDEDAISGLNEASSRFHLGLSELGNDDLSQGLIQLDLIRCQIQAEEGVAVRLRLRGQDASALASQIQDLQGLVVEGLRRMRMGDYSGAIGLFGGAAQGGQYYGSGQGGGGSGQGGGGKGSGGGK